MQENFQEEVTLTLYKATTLFTWQLHVLPASGHLCLLLIQYQMLSLLLGYSHVSLGFVITPIFPKRLPLTSLPRSK